MAKIGFEYIVAAKLNEKVSKSLAKAKYTDAREIGPAANVNGSPTSNDVKDYGDDRAVETDTSVTGGTISLELNEPTMENEAFMLGHSLTDEGGMLRNSNDIAPYVGIGFVGKSKRNNKLVFRAKIYLKTQFRVPNDENATKQEQVTFSHTTMEGSMFQLENGDWKDEKEFTALDAAKKFINRILGLKDDVQIPDLSQDLGEANKNHTVEEMIGEDAKIKWNGTKGAVTGTVKKNENFEDLYGEDGKSGHFFPFEFGEEHYGQQITLSGATKGDKDITPSEKDPYLIIRLENLTDKKLTAKNKKTSEVIFDLDFTGVTQEGGE